MGVRPQLIRRVVRRQHSRAVAGYTRRAGEGAVAMRTVRVAIATAVVVAGTVLLLPADTNAQETECTYDACALRMRYRFMGARLVQGVEEKPVGSVGLFAGSMPLLADRSDSAGIYYRAFHSANKSSSWLLLGGVAAFATGFVVAVSDGEHAVVTVSFVAGLGLLTGGLVRSSQAQERLSKAVWWYNRALPPSH